MKNGIFKEEENLVYYKDGVPFHAGAIKHEGNIYYIGKDGVAVKGVHVVHSSMANGLLSGGTYIFGDDGRLIEKQYSKKKRKSKKKINLSKKSKKKFLFYAKTIGIIAIVLSSFMFLASLADVFFGVYNGEESEEPKKVVELSFEEPKDEVSIYSTYFVDYCNGKRTLEEILQYGSPFVGYKFKYSIVGGTDGRLLISESEDMENASTFVLKNVNTEITVDNLKPDTVYYYVASAGETEQKGSFKTAKTNRLFYIDGIYNCRDIGGYETINGETVKSGLVIRGGEIDGLVVSSFFLKREDAEAFVAEFGFVYDFDLRGTSVFGGNYRSRLGQGVDHKFYEFPYYGGIFNENNKYIIKRVFTDLANPNNYPMYLHCTYGADRTGVVVFLLQGILGVPEEKMFSEYRLTAFANASFRNNKEIEIVASGFEGYEGETINEKIENYLIDYVGVSMEEIESIRNIMLEK